MRETIIKKGIANNDQKKLLFEIDTANQTIKNPTTYTNKLIVNRFSKNRAIFFFSKIKKLFFLKQNYMTQNKKISINNTATCFIVIKAKSITVLFTNLF